MFSRVCVYLHIPSTNTFLFYAERKFKNTKTCESKICNFILFCLRSLFFSKIKTLKVHTFKKINNLFFLQITQVSTWHAINLGKKNIHFQEKIKKFVVPKLSILKENLVKICYHFFKEKYYSFILFGLRFY